MLIDIAEIKKEFAKVDEKELERKLTAIELFIRKHTNNNFQVRSIRFEAASDGNTIKGAHQLLKVGDTIQISESENNGLYVITEIADGQLTTDKELHTVPHNLVTKVEYPADVIDGALELLKWRINYGGKIGVKSETLSRHSVTYYDNTSATTGGYPVALMGFCEPYMKARF